MFVLASAPAGAADTWTTPFPGVRLLHRTGANNLNAFLAVVDLCEAGVGVRMTGFSEKGQRTSAFATSVGAQLAINGDFSCRSVDVVAPSPFPPCLGLPVFTTYGSAAHAGVAWPNTISLDALLAVGADRVQIFDDDENQPIAPWMSEAVGGHWSIVRDGMLLPNDCPIDPRSAVGLSANHDTLYLGVADGRGTWRGMTCLEMAQMMIDFGADRAFALDSGGSSTIWAQGLGVLNHPSDGTERVVGNHIAIYATGAGRPPHCEQPPTVVNANAPIPAATRLGQPVPYSSFSPRRLFDTRTPSGSANLLGAMRDGANLIAAGSSFSVVGEPGASSLVLRFTTADTATSGFVSAWPTGGTQASTSVLNQAPGRVMGNTTIARQGTNDQLTVFTSSATQVIADAVGAFGPSGTTGFVPEAPRRLLDTRNEPMPGLQANVPRTVVPAQAGVDALVLNVTSVGSAAPGFVTLFACGTPVPITSAVNFGAGAVVAAFALAKTGPSGLCAVSNVDTHLLVDAFGRFESGGLGYQAVQPLRLVDTRATTGRWVGRTTRNTPLELNVSSVVPAGTRAIALNATVTGALDDGFLTLFPCAQARPNVSNLNYAFGETVANSAIVDVGDGRICLQSSGRTHVILDLLGAFVPLPIVDAGVPVRDAGVDAGSSTSDAGQPRDAGTSIDAGLVDDAGTSVDAGEDDAGPPRDAGVDAGQPLTDAGTRPPDGGTEITPDGPPGCGCSSTNALFLLILVALPRRRLR